MCSNLCLDLLSSQPWSAAQQAARGGWHLDLVSFAVGFVLALLLVGLAYRYRELIAQYRDQVKEQTKQLRQRFVASMATRYSTNVIETAQTMHLWGALASLDKIYVETQLYAPLVPAEDETVAQQIGLRAQRPAEQAIQASDCLVIIGQPGSGRTTLLNHLLLRQAARLHAAGEDERVPVYAYLPALAMGLAEADESPSSAPAARLVETAVASMSRIVATGVTRWLQRQVEAGNALVLLDDWDKVPTTERPAVTQWIQGLSAAYPDNRIIVTTGERGYAPLIEAGLAPLRPAPWTRRQLLELTQRWVEVFQNKFPSSDDNDRPVASPTVSHHLTPPTPLQATLELVIQLHGHTPARTPAGRMAQVLNLILPPPEPDDKGHLAWPPETGYRALGRLALATLEQGQLMLERDEIQSTVTEALSPPRFASDEEPEEGFSKEELKAAEEEKERRTLQVVDCCRALTATGAPVRAWGNRRYLFIHALVADYLAARYLAEADADGVTIIVKHADDPAWLNVLRFYAGLASAEPLVKQLLGAPDDLFLNRLWTASALLGATPPVRQPWREALLARLAQLLMNPRLPLLLRDRALHALIDSGEAGVGAFFKKAAEHPDAHLRAGATLGLGVLKHEQDLPLIEAALHDDDFNVRLAAVNALSYLGLAGSEKALELLIATLVEADDEVQRVAAEILAELGPEGKAVLQDGAKDQDLMLRRAAVYGLAVANEPWAREMLEHMQREDDEWIVRSAAAEALSSMGVGDEQETPPLDLTPPQPETEPWLITWAAKRGEGTGVGEAAQATLMRALREGDPDTRLMAIETLERLADPRTTSALRQSLRDPEPLIRDAALSALDEISRRHDRVISSR